MAKDTFFRKKMTLNAGGKLIDLQTPLVMGIINITPDSFFAESRKANAADAIKQAGKMLADGADILDIGAYSTRPGATDISVQEETDRLMPVVEAIVARYPDAILSIDTFRSAVAKAAIKMGAHIVNDISGGTLDDDMFATVAQLQVPYVLTHTKGTPQNMVEHAKYKDIFDEVINFFIERCYQLKTFAVNDVIIDPGFGFAKTQQHSYILMSRLNEFKQLGLPVLTGFSRKRMIYNVTGGTAADALNGTTVLNTIALTRGANILRVHDVKEAGEAINLWMLTR